MFGPARTRLPALLILAATSSALAAPQPGSLLDVVRGYADAMLEKARDTYGPTKSPMILSAFDRTTMKPLTTRPAPPAGVRRGDRSGPPWEALTGANPQLDQNLLRILYTLTEITSEKKYAAAADAEIAWFFRNTLSPATDLLAWGEHLCWETVTDQVRAGGADEEMHEFARPWVLWDRTYALVPEESKRFALGIWNHQIANHKTGGFDRHAPYFEHGPVDGKDFARHAGFYIQTWAFAYKHTQDPMFLNAIEVLLARYERKRKQRDGSEAATIGPLDTYTASTLVPEPLSKRLRDFAAREDELMTREFYGPDGKLKPLKGTWQAGYSSGVTASNAMTYLARYQQVENPAYREYIVAAADAYVGEWPAEDADVWAMTFGHIVSTQVAAYRLTGKPLYLDEAERIARLAVDLLWEDKPIPRASTHTGHYESICGPDTLALALLQVHAARTNLKVPIPANNIDR